MKSKILITIKKGMIESISCNTQDVEISVADMDIDGEQFTYYKSTGDKILSESEFNNELKKLENISEKLTRTP